MPPIQYPIQYPPIPSTLASHSEAELDFSEGPVRHLISGNPQQVDIQACVTAGGKADSVLAFELSCQLAFLPSKHCPSLSVEVGREVQEGQVGVLLVVEFHSGREEVVTSTHPGTFVTEEQVVLGDLATSHSSALQVETQVVVVPQSQRLLDLSAVIDEVGLVAVVVTSHCEQVDQSLYIIYYLDTQLVGVLESIHILLPCGEVCVTGVNWIQIVAVAVSEDPQVEHVVVLSPYERPKEGQSVTGGAKVIINTLSNQFLELQAVVEAAGVAVGSEGEERTPASEAMTCIDTVIEETPAAGVVLVGLDAGTTHRHQ